MTNHQTRTNEEASTGGGDRFKIADGTHCSVSLPSMTIPSNELPAPLHPSSPPLRASRSTSSSKPASVAKLSSDAVFLSSDDNFSTEAERENAPKDCAPETETSSVSSVTGLPASNALGDTSESFQKEPKLNATSHESKDDQRISTMLRKGRSKSVYDRSISPDPQSCFLRARSFPKDHAPQESPVPMRCSSAPENEDPSAGAVLQDELRYYEELATVQRYWREIELHNEEMYRQSQISCAAGYDTNLYKNQRRHVSSGNKFYAHVVRSRAAGIDHADHNHGNEHDRHRRPTM